MRQGQAECGQDQRRDPRDRERARQRRLPSPAPVLSVPSAVPIQETKPPASAIDGTLAQSIGMKTNGQAAAIQPMVPQTRMKPKSFWASLMLAKAIALVTDIVGT